MTDNTNLRRWAALALIAVLGLLALFWVHRYFAVLAAHENRRILDGATQEIRSYLFQDMRSRVEAVEDLKAFMLVPNRLPSFEWFDRFSQRLLAHHPTIRGLAYVDTRNIIRHFYPLAGNERAIGLDLMTRPAAPYIEKARRERRLTVNNPTVTVQGSLSVIARAPLYRGDVFLGLVQGVFDISVVMQEVSGALDPHLGLQLHDSEGRQFFGAAALAGDTRIEEIPVGDNRWRLTVGWKALTPGVPSAVVTLIWVLGGALLVSLLFIVNRGFTRTQWLRTAVAERTKALRENISNLHAVFENANDGILVNSGNEHIFANRRIAEMLGYQENELIGTQIRDLVSPDEYEKVEERYRRRMSGEEVPYRYEIMFAHKNGHPVPVEITSTKIAWEGADAAMVIVRDITERKQAERRIQQLNRLLRTISEINQMIVRETERDRVLQQTCHVLVEQGEFRMAWIGLADLATKEVKPVAQAGVTQDYLEQAQIRYDDSPQGQGPTGVAIRSGCYVVNDDTETNTQFALWRERARELGYRSSAAFPLRVHDRIAGAINVYASQPHAFGSEEVELLEELAADIGYALQVIDARAERGRMDAALHESRERLEAVISNTPIVLYALDRQGLFTLSTGKGLEVLGLKTGEVVGRSAFDIYRDQPQILEYLRRALDGEMLSAVVEVEGKYFDAWCAPQKNANGEVTGVLGVATDITVRMASEAEMRKLSSALTQTADAVMITDRQGVIEYVNPAFEVITGYSRAEALGQKPTILKSGKQGSGFYRKLWQAISQGEAFTDVFVNRRKIGTLYYEEKTITPLRNRAGEITNYISTGKDITERVEAQERLQHMAHHDALTDLPNRMLFMDRLKHSLARARWHGRLVVVMFLDLDRFKNINDTLGHETGDRVLQDLARRLAACVREGDSVARFGGDEFTILLDDVQQKKDIILVVNKVLETFKSPFLVEERELFITPSIGVSLYPNDGEDATTLLRNADIAMYRAKELGKNTYQFYSADMVSMAVDRLSLESNLRRALERNEFLLNYQPQVYIETGEIVGLEALLRWQHPDFGLVQPMDFIPLLEETGLIVPAGEWVLRSACRQVYEWNKNRAKPLRVSVNLSARQFDDPDLAGTIERVLQETGLPPALLELEITESVIMRNAQSTIVILESLNRLGVLLAIDDFGTGYSSLSYLRRFTIDTLKIDRTFIQDIPGDADDEAIAAAIIVMAQRLNLHVLAEGVETQEQLQFLRNQGCHTMQGFLFSRPLPPDELTPRIDHKMTR